MMKRTLSITLLVIVLLLPVAQLWSQPDRNIQQDLHRLEALLNRLRSLGSMIQDPELRAQLTQYLSEIEADLRAAQQFARQRRWELARSRLKMAFEKLKLLETRIQHHPAFRIRFKEEVDRQIHRAETLLAHYDNEQAWRMLERARFFRNKAFHLSQSNNPLAALEYYRMAIFFAERAIELVSPRDLAQDAQAFLHDVELLYRRAEQLVQGREDAHLQGLFTRATHLYREVRQKQQAGNLSVARQKATGLSKLLYRIIDLAENVPQAQGRRLNQHIQALTRSLAALQSNPKIQEQPETRALLARTETFLKEANQLVEQNRFRLARQKLLLANRLIVKLERLASEAGENPKQKVEQEFARARRTLREIQSSATASQFASTIQLVEKNLRQAEQLLAEEKWVAALRVLKTANLLLAKLNQLIFLKEAREVEVLVVQTDIARLTQLIQRIESQGQGNEVEQLRLDNARELLKMARKAFEEKHYRLSQQYAQLGITILTR